jgi:hypothetical protein
MANQLNFITQINNSSDERIHRLSTKDYDLVVRGEVMKLFGTSPKDNLEVWFYFPDGSFASTVKIPITDNSIMLSTMYDVSGYFEYINVNLETVIEYAKLAPGRYSVTIYFFSDEIGSRGHQKLLVKEISPSRTELKLSPVNQNNETATEIFEFVVPSVPRVYAEGIIDEISGQNSDLVKGEAVTITDITQKLDQATLQRISNCGGQASFVDLYNHVMSSMFSASLDKISTSNDPKVQMLELQAYMSSSLSDTIINFKNSRQIDPRFKLV